MTNQASEFALRFISGKYQGGEFPLPMHGEIVVGREGELDLVLMEDMVSRRHAKLILQENEVSIQDLGSTNGTFVNGEKIDKAALTVGDRVLIGTSILKLISSADSMLQESGFAMDPIDVQNMLDELAEQRKDLPASDSGSLAETPVPDLLQMFANMKNSGTLSLRNRDESGRVYFRDGKIFYSLLNNNDDLGPKKALFRMYAWSDGEFRFGPTGNEDFVLELEEETDKLVLEAARSVENLRKLMKDLPEMEDMVSLTRPLEARLAELAHDELEVLQVTINMGFIQSILDGSPYSDVRTAEILKKLLKQGYIGE